MNLSPLEELERRTLPAMMRQNRRRLQILILEDEEADRMRLVRVLRRASLDADVTEVDSVDEFQPALMRQRFDIVFIDYWLGFENGLDALQILLADPTQTRAVPVMLSRATEPNVIVEAMRAGFADYIVKDTLDIDTVRGCIAAAFERRILLAAMYEARELRMAIRRLVERLGQGRIPGLAEQAASYEAPPAPAEPNLPAAASRRLSTGLLADLELLWHLRRQGTEPNG
ncbi:MAG: response regulator [Pseudomonadota bacterium]